MTTLDDRTIQDFDEQLTRYTGNEGWYASLDLFKDIVAPLLSAAEFHGKVVADIGSGTGRIVGMLLQAGAARVYGIEPAPGAFEQLKKHVNAMPQGEHVTCINARGDSWQVDEPLDYVISIGVIPFIFDPSSTLQRAYDSLKPGGQIFIWLYAHEGNELFLRFVQPLRKLTTRLPHFALKLLVELVYGVLCVYRFACKFAPLPLRKYIETVLWPMTPENRRHVIYDQLNPTHAKYHKRHEALAILEKAGFGDLEIHHRHGYSWSVKGTKIP